MTTTAKIAAKGCNGTGITEELAEKLHNQLGRKVLAVVELVAEARSEKRNGDESVALSILTLEPAPNGDTEDHLRNLARAFHYERGIAEGQLTIESQDDLEPKVADVLAAGRAREPHDFTPAPEDAAICDVCGDGEETSLHSSAQLDLNIDDDENDDENEDGEGYQETEGDFDDYDAEESTPGPDDDTTEPHLTLANPFTTP